MYVVLYLSERVQGNKQVDYVLIWHEEGTKEEQRAHVGG